MTFSIREPIRQWLERIDAAVTALQTATTGLVPTSGQKDALAGTSGTPSSSNKYVTDADPRVPAQAENDALVGTSGTPSSSNKYVTDGDSRNTNSRAPTGSAGGSVGGTFPSSLTVTKLDETSGPTALTIGAVSAPQFIQRYGTTAVGRHVRTMYEAEPATYDSWGDEFEDGNDDPTARGWSVVQLAPTVAAMTRLGGVDATIVPPTAMSAGQYRSSVRNGKLYVQVGGNSGNIIYIYKATTSAAFAYAASLGTSIFTTNNTYQALHVTDSVSVAPGNAAAKSVTIERYGTGGTPQTAYKYTGVTVASYLAATPGQPFGNFAMHIDWRAGSSLVDVTSAYADSDPLGLVAYGQSPPTSWAPGFAGVLLRNSNTAGQTRNWCAVDYIRRYPSGSFFPV